MRNAMIDLTKPVRTKRGEPVTILKTDAKGDYPVVGLRDFGEAEEPACWRADGQYDVAGPSNYDLENVPERLVRFTNLYLEGPGSLYLPTLEEAKRCTLQPKLGIIKIVTDGDKLVSATVV